MMRLKVRVKQPLSKTDLAQLKALGCEEKPFIERPFELLFAATDEHEQELRALACVMSVGTMEVFKIGF